MVIKCPSCQHPVEIRSPPIRGQASDGSEAWVCLYCPSIICVDCYCDHTRIAHPSVVTLVEKEKKKKKK